MLIHSLDRLWPERGVSPLEVPVEKRRHRVITLRNEDSELAGGVLDGRVLGV